MADGTETVTLKLPSGEMVDAVVPAGMPDAAIQNMMRAKHPEFFQSAPAPQQAAALGNKALAAINPALQGTQVGRLPNIQMQLPGAIPRALTAAGATLPSASPYDPNRSIIQQQMENMRSANPSNAAAAGKELLNRFGTGDIAGGIGEVGGYLAQALLAKKALGESSPGMAMQSQVEGGIYPNSVRAGRAIGQAEQVAGKLPVDSTGPGSVVLEAQKLQAAGQTLPRVMQRFIARITDPSQGPLTFEEARRFLTTAGQLSANENLRLTPQMRRQLATFQDELNQSIRGTANAAGVGGTYDSGITEYRRAAQMNRTIESMKNIVKSEAAKSAAQAAGIGAGGYAAYKALSKK